MCNAVTARGQCRMPNQRGAQFCFAHDPGAARERAAARRSGGRASAEARRAQLPPPPIVAAPAAPSGGLDLGELKTLREIATATITVTKALASSAITPQKARALAELLTAAEDRARAGGADPDDGREPNLDEATFIATHAGQLPPGVSLVSWKMRVEGAQWRAPAVEPDAAPAPEAPAAAQAASPEASEPDGPIEPPPSNVVELRPPPAP